MTERFDAVVLATPLHVTRDVAAAAQHGARMAGLLPQQATSAIVVALAFAPEQAAACASRAVLVLWFPSFRRRKRSIAPVAGLHLCPSEISWPRPARGGAPTGLLRRRRRRCASGRSRRKLIERARLQLSRVLGPLPEAAETVVRRWPQSLPQYAVGHLERMAELESMLSAMPGLHLVGSAYYGVGLPDLIRQGRAPADCSQGRHSHALSS